MLTFWVTKSSKWIKCFLDSPLWMNLQFLMMTLKLSATFSNWSECEISSKEFMIFFKHLSLIGKKLRHKLSRNRVFSVLKLNLTIRIQMNIKNWWKLKKSHEITYLHSFVNRSIQQDLWCDLRSESNWKGNK